MSKSSESKSPDFYRFFRLIDFEKACLRRMAWYILEIEGTPQYYYNKLIFERGKVFEHLLSTFPNASGDTDLARVDQIFQGKFTEEDTLDCCNLKDVPPEALNLSHIEKLSLEKNHLIAIPDDIDNLSSLKFLYLKFNNLKSLPSTIKNIQSLEQIELFGNSITEIDFPLSFWPPIISDRIRNTLEFFGKP